MAAVPPSETLARFFFPRRQAGSSRPLHCKKALARVRRGASPQGFGCGPAAITVSPSQGIGPAATKETDHDCNRIRHPHGQRRLQGRAQDFVFDLDLASLGRFRSAIANPPFGAMPRRGNGPRYTGRAFEFHLIDLASDIADYGAFIIPQASAPFEHSGVQCYRERRSADYLKFAEQTGIHLEAGCGVDCAYHRDAWKGIAPNVEIVCANFEDMPVKAPDHPLMPRPSCAASGPKMGYPQSARMP
jgi:hypothetical protein